MLPHDPHLQIQDMKAFADTEADCQRWWGELWEGRLRLKRSLTVGKLQMNDISVTWEDGETWEGLLIEGTTGKCHTW